MHLLNDKTKKKYYANAALQVMYRLSYQTVCSWRKSSESKSLDCNGWSYYCRYPRRVKYSSRVESNVVRVLKSMTALSESEVVPRPGHDDRNTNDGQHNSQSYLCTRGEARA
jgi:hypothetical protein